MIKQLIYFLSISIVLFFSAALGVLFYVSAQPGVDLSVLEHYNPGKPSLLLDDEGNEWGRFALDKRDIIKLSSIPKSVINAFLAAEDWSFFSHKGLSLKGIARSVLVNITSLRKAQGASTITQQLVRLLFFETQKSFKRKIKEQILSIVVERQFTKEQILETYLNHIYLGGGIYGVEAACQRFWGKSVKDVTPDEAASLAAIVRCPQEYCPLYNRESNRKRRNLILKNMFNLQFITKSTYEECRQKPVTVLKRDIHSIAPHLKEAIRLFLEETIGKQLLYTGGLRIQTTLNRKMQETAEKVFHQHFQKLHKKFSPDLNGALVCIEGSTGAIKSIIGGYDYQVSQFNRAFKARRQMGSTFKPLIYAHALMQGKSFSDIEIDEPLTLTINNQEWSPSNAKNTFEGPMTLAHALSTSSNIVTIKVFLQNNPEAVGTLASSCGLTAPHTYPSLALGCIDATPLENACMMNVFAHQGVYSQPYFLAWVKDEWGTKIWKAKTEQRHILPSLIVSQVARILMLRIDESKKRHPKSWFEADALGKTGTTNDARTTWFVGATPRYTTAICVGYDDNRPLGKEVFGAQTAVPMWKDFNKQIPNDVLHFAFDPRLQETTIHSMTGQLASPTDPGALTILQP